ncbi:helix-turn-helix domain-containing protein, partial [Caldimonas thermodepolymerans]
AQAPAGQPIRAGDAPVTVLLSTRNDMEPWRLVLVKSTEFQRLQKRLAERVRSYRKLRNISQEDLADLAEIDRTYVSQSERAVGNPSLGVMVKVAGALDVHVTDLLQPAT